MSNSSVICLPTEQRESTHTQLPSIFHKEHPPQEENGENARSLCGWIAAEFQPPTTELRPASTLAQLHSQPAREVHRPRSLLVDKYLCLLVSSTPIHGCSRLALHIRLGTVSVDDSSAASWIRCCWLLPSPTLLGTWCHCHCYSATSLLRAHHLVVECLAHALARSDSQIVTLYIDIDMYMAHRPCYLDYIPPQHMIPTSWYQPYPNMGMRSWPLLPNKGGLCMLRTLHYACTLYSLLACMHDWLHGERTRQ